jgi:hypothetical protein
MKFQSRLGRKLSLGLALMSLALHGFVWQSQAQIVTLQHNNSTAQINTGSSAGMFHWDVQGQNQLNQQWFWYRVGSSGPEQSINTISPPVNTPFLGTRGVTTVYANASFNIEIDYLLQGGSIMLPGQVATADLTESISIHNTSAAPLDFHFFQYSDFDLAGAGGDTVRLGTDPSGNFNSANQSDGISTLTESVSVTAPSASRGEANLFNATLVKLSDGNPDSLNNNGGPVGPGNVTWALEWDVLLNPNATFLISKDKHLNVQIVPEPSSLILFPLGLLAFGCYSRRQRK